MEENATFLDQANDFREKNISITGRHHFFIHQLTDADRDNVLWTRWLSNASHKLQTPPPVLPTGELL